MTTDIDRIISDLSAFADDDDDVVVDSTGALILARNGKDISGRLFEDVDRGLLVEVDGECMSYSRFITHHLARLDVFAERLLAKRSDPPNFIDGPGRLDSPREDPSEAPALSLLTEECRTGSPFATRVVFITADAGHGKTILLREHQHRQAEAFLAGKASYLFWHVDLQGRQLVRLSEALMGDLGDLRITGLWMPAILKLIQQRAVVLAIDGFDELAAEQGSTDALGALAVLVKQLAGHGVVVAASRRTFFDTEDYIARAGLLRRSMAAACEFDQISLRPWGRGEVLAFLSGYEMNGKHIPDAEATLDSLQGELGGDAGHPMLTRPFLVSQIARALALYNTTPGDFIRGMDDPLKGVAALVQAFVQREVAEKWRHRESGEPYLTIDQHMELLSVVADEMYQAQQDRLGLDIIETLAALLFEKWGIDADKRVSVMQMVRMHVLLTVPPDGSATSRSFDHAEFRDYFVAYSLRAQLDQAAHGEVPSALGRFLSLAQISDSTARYVCSMLELNVGRSTSLTAALSRLGLDEWRPTFLHTNIGTLLPFVLDKRDFASTVEFDGKAVFSSLVFEGKTISNVCIKSSTFLNASFLGTTWIDVRFVNCVFGDLTLDLDATVSNTVLDNCEFTSVRLVKDDEEIAREYAPTRVKSALVQAGFQFVEAEPLLFASIEESPLHRLVRKTLRMFQRTTVINESGIQQRFRADFRSIMNDVVPLLERHNVIEARAWHGSGSQGVWSLTSSLDEILASDEPIPTGPYAALWAEVAASS